MRPGGRAVAALATACELAVVVEEEAATTEEFEAHDEEVSEFLPEVEMEDCEVTGAELRLLEGIAV